MRAAVSESGPLPLAAYRRECNAWPLPWISVAVYNCIHVELEHVWRDATVHSIGPLPSIFTRYPSEPQKAGSCAPHQIYRIIHPPPNRAPESLKVSKSSRRRLWGPLLMRIPSSTSCNFLVTSRNPVVRHQAAIEHRRTRMMQGITPDRTLPVIETPRHSVRIPVISPARALVQEPHMLYVSRRSRVQEPERVKDGSRGAAPSDDPPPSIARNVFGEDEVEGAEGVAERERLIAKLSGSSAQRWASGRACRTRSLEVKRAQVVRKNG